MADRRGKARCRPRAWRLVAGLLAAVVLPGCALGDRSCIPRYPASVSSASNQDSLPPVERGALTPRVEGVHRASYTQPAPIEYRALTPVEAQCMAAAESTLGNMLDSERRVIWRRAQQSRRGPERADRLRTELLSAAAHEARNRSARDALEAYYRLAQAEAQADILNRAIAEAEQAQRDIEQLRARGLQTPPEADAFQTRAIELHANRVELETTIVQLNAALQSLIDATGSSAPYRIWPQTEFTATDFDLDVDAAIATGRFTRRELVMLRRLNASLDYDTLDVARQAASAVNPVMGRVAAAVHCSHLGKLLSILGGWDADAAELAERRRQLRQYAADRESQIAADIRREAELVRLRFEAARLAESQVERWRAKVDETQQRRAAGSANFLDLASARLSLRQAEGELAEAVAEWHIAVVRFKEAQGLLAEECEGSARMDGTLCCPSEPATEIVPPPAAAGPAVDAREWPDIAHRPAVAGATVSR